MKPRWMRINAACPNCGLILTCNGAAWQIGRDKLVSNRGPGFTCARCGEHYTEEDFWQAHHDKMAHIFSEYNGESTCIE